jgi:hypothetical protein
MRRGMTHPIHTVHVSDRAIHELVYGVFGGLSGKVKVVACPF